PGRPGRPGSARRRRSTSCAARSWRTDRRLWPPVVALGDADLIAERVADSHVDAVGMLFRFLDDLRAAPGELGVRGPAIVGVQDHPRGGAAFGQLAEHGGCLRA